MKIIGILAGIFILIMAGCSGGGGDAKDKMLQGSANSGRLAALGDVTITAPTDCDIKVSGPNISTVEHVVEFAQVESGVYSIEIIPDSPDRWTDILEVGIRINGSNKDVPSNTTWTFENPPGIPYCVFEVTMAGLNNQRTNN